MAHRGGPKNTTSRERRRNAASGAWRASRKSILKPKNREQMANNGTFSANPKTEWLDEPGDDRHMRLLNDFWYEDPDGRRWPTPAGSVIDGASILAPSRCRQGSAVSVRLCLFDICTAVLPKTHAKASPCYSHNQISKASPHLLPHLLLICSRHHLLHHLLLA